MANAYNRITGRLADDQSAIMKVLRQPVFVDNATVHGEYTKTNAGYKVAPPTSGDFEPSHDRTYMLVEEENGVRLLHNSSYDGGVFYSDRKLTDSETPPVMLFAEKNSNNRLVPEEVQTASTGSLLTLKNMNGKSLSNIGFEEKNVRLGQTADVGFRTSDLALKVADTATGSVNSSRTEKNRHSTSFLAHDFDDTDAIAAIRYISKHDGQGLRSDNFGNLIYTNQNQGGRAHYITRNMVTGGTDSDNVSHAPNRVTVYGKKRANNVDNVVRIDDIGAQYDGVVNEAAGGIHVPTASTEASARRIGQRVLATAKRATGSKRIKGVIRSLGVKPGDTINLQTAQGKDQYIVLETEHNLSGKVSSIQVSSVSATLDDTLKKFQEDRLSMTDGTMSNRTKQLKTHVFSSSADLQLKSTWILASNTIKSNGLIIGHPTRGYIHGHVNKPKSQSDAAYVISMCKSRTVIRGRG